MSALRAWQFVLMWDGAWIVVTLLGTVLGQWLWGRPFDPGTILGTATGAVIASSITAFPARIKIQGRA